MKGKLEYYYLTLSNGVSSIVINNKIIPIIGVFIAENDMRCIQSAKKIAENLKREPMDGLSYIECIPVPDKEIKELETILFGMTIEEKQSFQNTMAAFEEKAKENYYLKDAFGIGDIVSRRLQYRSGLNKDQR